MIVITVARKPLSEGTVASNVLKHGTGAINIDASRVGVEETVIQKSGRFVVTGSHDGYTRPGASKYTHKPEEWSGPANTAGRWPANLLLQHAEGCVQEGVMEAKASAPMGRPCRGTPNTGVFSAGTLRIGSGYGEGGTETVEAWKCVSGCPVAALDQQSGVLHSQDPATRRGHPGKHGTGNATTYLSIKETGQHYADKGGASRFFKQLKHS